MEPKIFKQSLRDAQESGLVAKDLEYKGIVSTIGWSPDEVLRGLGHLVKTEKADYVFSTEVVPLSGHDSRYFAYGEAYRVKKQGEEPVLVRAS